MTIQLQPVKSSQIAAVGYDAPSQTLAIQFKSGGTYYYANVPAALYKQLVTAPSIGSFFYRQIKPKPTTYPFTKVK